MYIKQSHSHITNNDNDNIFLKSLFSSFSHPRSSYDDEEDYESNIDILESHLDDQIACDINEL